MGAAAIATCSPGVAAGSLPFRDLAVVPRRSAKNSAWAWPSWPVLSDGRPPGFSAPRPQPGVDRQGLAYLVERHRDGGLFRELAPSALPAAKHALDNMARSGRSAGLSHSSGPAGLNVRDGPRTPFRPEVRLSKVSSSHRAASGQK